MLSRHLSTVNRPAILGFPTSLCGLPKAGESECRITQLGDLEDFDLKINRPLDIHK